MPKPLADYDLLVISDLHLGEGRDPARRKFSRKEDFFSDEEFTRFLAYHQRGTPGHPRERKWHLIINGDFLDFLQVTTTEGARPELIREAADKKYGLDCGSEETVFKLGVVMKGHWKFFEALAEFVVEGHIISISKGNHDPEFFYAAVQAAFVSKLREIYAEKLCRENDPNASTKLSQFEAACQGHAIRFLDWFYYERDVLWVEHGNQYDRLNNWEYWLEPLLPTLPLGAPGRQDEIDLPWGNLFVRYLFNRVEQQAPSVDNIKPLSRSLSWFLTRHLCLAVRFVFTDGQYMLGRMARAWKRLPPGAYDLRRQHHEARLAGLELAARVRVSLGWFLLIFVLLLAGWWVRRCFASRKKRDDVTALAEQAARICTLLGVRYVTMGHTHQTDLRVIGDRGEYFNTGTWTKVLRPDEEHLIEEESELVFLQLVRQPSLKARLLKWSDAANEPRLVKLFKDLDEP